MNQILSVDMQSNKKPKKSSIHSILIVFAIILMIFGIGLTTSGAYSYYKNVSNNSIGNVNVTSNTKPMITIDRENANTILIVVTHDKEIASVRYQINDEEEIEVEQKNRSKITEEVELPAGTVNVKIIAEDINGIKSSYEKTFEVDAGPTITLTPQEGKLQAVTESEINIDYIMYYWDDDEENAVKYPINDIKNETLIDVSMEGTHTLNIIAVDIEGHKTTKTQKVMGVNKPKIEITTDGESFFITATDTEGLSKIEIKLNSNDTVTEEISGKEYSTTIKLDDGVNRLKVTVYNVNDISNSDKVRTTKE